MTPPRYQPMLAVSWPRAFSDPAWRFEVKWDGVRVLLTWDGHDVGLRTRRGREAIRTYPELAGFRWPRPVVVDGEVVVIDEHGRPTFQGIQARMNLADGREADRSRPLAMMAFDLLYDGDDITSLPLEERRQRLEAEPLPAPLVLSHQVEADGEALFNAVQDQGLEGIVAKRIGSPYRSGMRSPEWRKVASLYRIRAVVGGFTPGEGVRLHTFGSLLVGLWDGDRLRWSGAVGTGFDDPTLVALRRRLDGIARDVSPFHPNREIPSGSLWVEPVLVAEVEFKQWTDAGRLRAPVYKGLTEVSPDEVTWAAEGPGD